MWQLGDYEAIRKIYVAARRLYEAIRKMYVAARRLYEQLGDST